MSWKEGNVQWERMVGHGTYSCPPFWTIWMAKQYIGNYGQHLCANKKRWYNNNCLDLGYVKMWVTNNLITFKMKVGKFIQTKPTTFRMVYKEIINGFGSSVSTHNWAFDKWTD